MKIYAANHVTEALSEALRDLVYQLNPEIEPPSKNWLEEVIYSANTTLFIAEDNGIAGTLTLVIQKTPSGKKAWIEDVVVNISHRGKGLGAKLIEHAIKHASESGISNIDLTSNPNRTAANKLYQNLGFKKRETNVYRLEIKKNTDR